MRVSKLHKNVNVAFLVGEFPRESGAPTGLLISDLHDFLNSREGWTSKLFCVQKKYRPGGMALARIANLIKMHFLFPFHLFFLRIQTLLTNQKLCVVATTSPPFIHWTIQLFSKVFGVPVLTWYQDAHPEIEVRILERKGFSVFSGLLRGLDAFMMRLPSVIVTLDKAMTHDLVRRTGIKTKILDAPPWATYHSPALPLRHPKNEPMEILYAGNYGAAHDLSPFVNKLKKLSQQQLAKFKFIFVGMNSESSARLKKLFDEIPVEKVFLPRFQNVGELFTLMQTVDFGLVSLSPAFAGIMCPSKAYTYLCQGTPVLYTGPDETLGSALCEQGWGVSDDQFLHSVAEPISKNFKVNFGHVFPNPREEAVKTIVENLERLVAIPH